MSELPVDEKDAPEGYYAAGDVGRGCMSCAFISSNAHCPRNVDGTYLCSSTGRKDNQSVYFIKKPESTKQSIVAEKKLYVHSEDGHVVLAFEGELQFLPRIAILNYADDPAKDIAEHMMALWNENANKIEKEGVNNDKEYPVVKMKELRNYTIGDVVRLKKTGELVEIDNYLGCRSCVLYEQYCRNQDSCPVKTGCYGEGKAFGGKSVHFKLVKE